MDKDSKEFKRLEKLWYKKLEKSGFEDLERGSGSQDKPLRSVSADEFNLFLNRTQHGGFHFKQEYYRIAGHFLHDNRFESKFDKKVWSLHAQGISIRKIVKILKLEKIATYRKEVDETIRRLANKMKSAYVKK